MPHYQENHISTLLEALNPVRDQVQNWGIDVAQYLETYLEQIASESVANFREAALLIQNSTVIYVKKVDYLWIITQQLVDNLRRQRYDEEKRNNEQAAVALDANPNEPIAARKKKKQPEESKYREINIVISDKLLELEPSTENRQPWKFLPDVYHQFQKRPLSNKKRVVYGVGGEEQEAGHFKSNSVLLPSMALHHEFKDESTAAFTCGVLPPADFTAVAAADDEEEVCDVEYLAKNSPRAEDIEDKPPSPLETDSEDPCVRDDTPTDVVTPALPADALETEKIENETNELEIEMAKLDQELIKIVTIKVKKSKAELLAVKKTWLVPRLTAYPLERNEDAFIGFKGFEDLETEDLSDDEKGGFRGFPEVEMPRKKSKRTLEKEAEVRAIEAVSNLPLPSEEEIRAAVLAEDNEAYAALQSFAELPPPAAADDELENYDAPDDAPDDGPMETEAEIAAREAAQAASQLEMAKRVNAWHQSIRPKLAQAEERGHFDIHNYGTKILAAFPKTSAKTTLSFSHLVEDVDSQDVARYFLSALQLANNMNVELEVPGDPLVMDQLDLTLLSHNRHHKHLEEYVAPSREDGAQGPITTSFHFAQPRKRK